MFGIEEARDGSSLPKYQAHGAESLRFLASDYEALEFEDEFDAAVFYDALHHAVDEREAMASAYRALKAGGILICHEPAKGHADAAESIKARERYDITEKDMPPERIVSVGRAVGFSSHELFSHSWRPRRAGPIEGFGATGALYWEKLMGLFGALGESRKDYQRRNMVVLRK